MKNIFTLLVVTILAFGSGIFVGDELINYIFANEYNESSENLKSKDLVANSTKDYEIKNTNDNQLNNEETLVEDNIHDLANDLPQYIFANSSTTLLSDTEIQALSKEDSVKALNEIFARYGHDFSSKSLKEYFTAKEWYQSVEGKKVSVSDLNTIEQKNVILLNSYIKKF